MGMCGDNRPVGFFDSGIGGYSILREVKKLLPNESTLYFADRDHCPYGPKSREEILERALFVTERLLAGNSKAIVVACNTATAAAIDYLRANYPVPFIGLEPAVKPAALLTKTGVIGVLATEGTISGRLFRETTSHLPENIRVVIRKVKGFVEAVEAGRTEPTPELLTLVEREIRPLLDEGADILVLGCTHFPFLSGVIREVAGESVQLIDPAKAVAQQLKRVLEKENLCAASDARPGHTDITVNKDENYLSVVRDITGGIGRDYFLS